MNENFNENVNKKCFRKFSVKTYRRILKAWMTTTDSLTSDSEDSCGQLHSSLKSIEIKTNEPLKETTEIIELNDSLDSIPETPEFVEKRKALKRQRNTKFNKRLISEFIDFEAEVVKDSKDSLCDDIENTQKESEGCSQIIDDIIPMDTQPIGRLINGIDSRSAEDMQTVYLRSVKDQMIGNIDKYKLQYNYDTNINVFSQEPNESDLEDYEFDSFCVPNDSIEFDESSPQTAINSIDICPQTNKRERKKFKRIVFSP